MLYVKHFYLRKFNPSQTTAFPNAVVVLRNVFRAGIIVEFRLIFGRECGFYCKLNEDHFFTNN